MQTKLFGIISVGFDITDQLPIRFLHLSDIGEKMGYSETLHLLFMNFMKANDSVRREVLYTVLIEFGVLMRLVTLLKMCLNETYSKTHIGNHLSDKFPIQNGLKQGGALLP
jgi:hypothetical protein